jgi:hypothetical protein
LVILCGAAGAASACQKQANRPLFDDNFKNADPGWGQPDNVAAFTQQGLVLTRRSAAAPGDGTRT